MRGSFSWGVLDKLSNVFLKLRLEREDDALRFMKYYKKLELIVK